jgi:hypothetical protein
MWAPTGLIRKVLIKPDLGRDFFMTAEALLASDDEQLAVDVWPGELSEGESEGDSSVDEGEDEGEDEEEAEGGASSGSGSEDSGEVRTHGKEFDEDDIKDVDGLSLAAMAIASTGIATEATEYIPGAQVLLDLSDLRLRAQTGTSASYLRAHCRSTLRSSQPVRETRSSISSK